jgi:putative salt-induced outer membrane protein
LLYTLAAIATLTASSAAHAQEPAVAPRGAPPPDAKAAVAAPKDVPDAPKIEKPVEGTTATLSAGALLTTGNSRLLAATANGSYETRSGDNGVGAALLANYGQGAPAGKAIQMTAGNIQGRLRYDRYFIERASGFLILTGRRDRFQGLDFRLNVDPGVKYLFKKEQASSIWGEAGYDFQYDIRRNQDRVVLDAAGAPVLDAAGQPTLLKKTATDHSMRLFLGARYAFNKEVTLSGGVEYLQSVVETTRNRINADALFAAKVGGGLAVGIGFSARYDHAPLPGKETLDTSTTVNLIYAFSDVPEPEKPKTCPCPEEIAPPPAPAPPPDTTPAPTPAPIAPAPPPEPVPNTNTPPAPAP